MINFYTFQKLQRVQSFHFLKTSFILVFISVLAFQTHAQAPISFGIKAGFNQTSLTGPDMSNPEHYKPRSALMVGVYTDYNFRNMPIRLETGAYYTQKGMINSQSGTNENDSDITPSYTIEYIEIPLFINYTPPLILWQDADLVVFGGPYLGYNLTREIQQDEFSEFFNEYDYGAAIGLAADGREWGVPIKIKGRYTHGLSSPFADRNMVNNSWGFSVGYYLRQ